MRRELLAQVTPEGKTSRASSRVIRIRITAWDATVLTHPTARRRAGRHGRLGRARPAESPSSRPSSPRAPPRAFGPRWTIHAPITPIGDGIVAVMMQGT